MHAMPLKDQLRALEQIQEVDLKIDNLRKNKGLMPAGMRALDERLGKLKSSASTKTTSISEMEKTQRQNQAAIDLTQDRLSRSTARLEGVQNTQEYQAATKEIDQLKKQQLSLEEGVKKLASDLEKAQSELAEIQVNVGKVQSEYDAEVSSLSGQSEKLESEIGSLMGERGRFTPHVEARLLSQYDRIRAARAGLGIVPAVAGRCKACNMMIPPQQFNELQRGNSLHQCPSCQRILFAPGITAAGNMQKG